MLKRILVTGGAGFLGSHLCERLVELGHDVICLDNFFTSQKTNVAHLLDRPNFDLVRHDVIQPIFLEVDEIYNLACPAAPGHYQFNGRIVSNFIRQALAGENITLYGDGSQSRSFCYRDDLVDGLIKLMECPDDFIGPCNLGNQTEFTVQNLAEQVIALTGSKSKIVHQALPADDPVRRQPDITLAKQHLG